MNWGKEIAASVEPVVNIPTEMHGKILAHNVVIEGIQFHHHLDHFLGESNIHTMARNVRRPLIKMGLRPVHIESILAATLLHSADHYYADHYLLVGQDRYSDPTSSTLKILINPPH